MENWSVHNEELSGRIIIGVFMSIASIALVSFISYIKKNHRQKNWFIPIGLKTSLYQSRYLIWKSDYPIWLTIGILALIYWLGGYWIVNLVQLGQYNQALQMAQEHGGIAYVWDPTKIIMNGDRGGFNAVFADGTELPNGATTLMPFVMKQTNVTYYLFNLVNDSIKGTNLQNHNTPFLTFPNMSDSILLQMQENGGTNLNFKDPKEDNYINDVLNNLTVENRTYMFSQMNLWVHSFTYSNVLLTPLCQFLSLAFPLSIVLSYKKDIVSLVAPWAFLGGFITIFGGIVADENIHVTWQLIFFDQQLFFGYHAVLMVGGLSWMFYCNRTNLLRFFYSYVFIAFYIAYVWMMSRAFNIQYFTTGLTTLDYSVSGSYVIVSLILRNSNILFPVNAVIMIIVFTTFLNLVITLKNIIHARFWKKQIKNYNETFINDIKYVYIGFSKKIKEMYTKSLNTIKGWKKDA